MIVAFGVELIDKYDFIIQNFRRSKKALFHEDEYSVYLLIPNYCISRNYIRS